MRKLILFLGFVFVLFSFAGAQVVSSDNEFYGGRSGTASFVNYGSSFTNHYGSQASTYWPVLSNRDECFANQDILVQVSFAGCQPAVVRSDLLAEQNVPVFCQLDLLQVNPAVNVKQIRNIRFNGRYPDYVAGVGFHPANAALKTTNQLLGTPLESNIGYVVVVLKRNPDENNLPEFFNFTLSASIDYYSGNAAGIGATELLIRETNDKEWEVAKNRQTLFNGKMSVRVKDTDNNNSIRVEIYSGDIKYSEMILQKNSPQSNAVYLPGSYCQTALQFTYSDFVSPNAIARVKVDDDILDLYEGSRFLNNKCLVRSVTEESIEVNCGSGNIKLFSSIEVLDIGEKVYLNDDLSVNKGVEYTISKIIKNSSGTFYDLGDRHVSISYIMPVSPSELFDKSYGDLDKYISESIANYEFVSDDYGNEKKDLGSLYGDVALSNAINLAIDYDKKITAVRLINKYIDSYPDGENRDRFAILLNDIYLKDSSSASASVEAEDGYHLIRLLDITSGGKKSSSKIAWGTQEQDIEQGQTKEFNNVGTLKLIRVRDSESIDVNASCLSTAENKDGFKGIVRIRGSNVVRACGANIVISNIEFENYVKLRISPITRSGTITNFTVGVGIEKRAIELTPDKAQRKIENLNESIKKWESISNSLGEVVTGLKTACFATAGVLTVKNFFSGLSGEALARRSVMSGEDGWTKFCEREINSGKYDGSMTQCYNKNSVDIKSDVESRKNAIENTNNLTEQIEKDAKYPNREGIFSGENFNDTQAKRELIERIRADCKNEISSSNMNSLFPSNYNADVYSYTQLRDIYYNCQAIKNKGSERGNKQAGSEIDSISKSIKERLEYENSLKSLDVASDSTGLKDIPVDVQGDSKSITGRYYGGKINALDFGLPASYVGKPAQIVYYNSQPYLAVLEEKSGGNIVVDKMFKLSKEGDDYVVPADFSEANDVKRRFSKFEKRDPSSYNNQFAPGEDTVRYFETEPYKGVPAIVPFDLNKGFYAATTQALPIFGGTKSYEDNGNPSSFFVCNVMSGGRIDFYAPNYGNDECVQFNIYTGQSFSNFPGLSESDTRKVVSEAIRALKDVASQYGKSSVKIGSNTLNVGRAASLLPGSQCQDFMSPEECKLLFNVCDPVICPNSRCNFGGEYYVSDVIECGIVGSALLCLPNWNEGIYIPVCLTGIKAGIDGYLSILKSHQQCLQEAVDTGKYVGICDQISSVYMCEFFWRQAAPLAKTVIPKLVEHAYTGGQGNVRGGGEYLTVQSSWENAQDSVEYFTQSYAANSFEAFRVRSVEEAGTEVCRAFISAKGPKTFEALVEPDSPSQFHAWYSSIDYTSATIPATSQYKVFYHIFAGNDRGVSYSVYLRDPPQNTQYATNPVVVVANGFVARGQYATESKDFTAPKGYQQLCVRINDKEECGFKQVSSSFAVNYVRDSIVADELTRTDITTESQCVSGSISPVALLNPNLQSSVEETLNPAIYNRGIVRVCATSNPGKGTNEARFVDVGYCGESRLRCWLDKNSLDDTITDVNVGLKNRTLSEIEQIQKDYLNDKERFIGSSDLKSELDSIIKDIDKVDSKTIDDVVNKLNLLFKRTTWLRDRAEILFWKATAYEKVFLKSFAELAINIKETENSVSDTLVVETPKTETPAQDLTGPRVLSFNGTYSSIRESYILINGRYTGIYLQGSSILFDGNVIDDVRIGGVDLNSGKISFLPSSKSVIDKAFGEGSYELFNDRIFVENIKSEECDLNVLATCTGAVENPK